MPGTHATAEPKFFVGALSALGIVYGDIGTSPLYAFRLAVKAAAGGGDPTEAQVLGVLSLIIWSLLVVIALKYVVFVMRADNHGEGGILALLALSKSWCERAGRKGQMILAAGLFGAALLYGDGVITPAISVLSAVEGLEEVTPRLAPYVLPVTAIILIGLFTVQSQGTARIGRLFGPIMALWFAAIALLGVLEIAGTPRVLAALSPLPGLHLILDSGRTAVFVIGAVFLSVTGGEALYADMGHVGRRAIRWSWAILVMPALILNYAGQAALLLNFPGAAASPFFRLAPAWLTLPLVLLATAATVIASQSLISGIFSLTRQAINLGLWPRMTVVQTSAEGYGQIYLPTVNWSLMLLVLAVVVGFGSSDALAGAYGIAVAGTMLITTVLLLAAMVGIWHWHPVLAAVVTAAFLVFDLGFAGANLLKVPDGGWMPLLLGGGICGLMAVWQHGSAYVTSRLHLRDDPMEDFQARLALPETRRAPGLGVFLTRAEEGMPAMARRLLRHHFSLPELVLVLTVLIEEVPRVPARERLTVTALGNGLYRVIARYGFMQTPNIPVALRGCVWLGIPVDLEKATFYISHVTIVRNEDNPALSGFAEWMFAFMARNAWNTTEYFKIPEKQTFEVGSRVEI